MTDNNTGGPAFPCEYEGSTRSDAYGMTLRDYFAAKAMQAMIANDWPMHSSESMEHLTSSAYRVADSMLEARQS